MAILVKQALAPGLVEEANLAIGTFLMEIEKESPRLPSRLT